MGAVDPNTGAALMIPGAGTPADNSVTTAKIVAGAATLAKLDTTGTAGTALISAGGGGAPVWQARYVGGPLSSRPAATAVLKGQTYLCDGTDAPADLFVCDGSTWQVLRYARFYPTDSSDVIYFALNEASGAGTLANTGTAGGTLTVAGTPILGRQGMFSTCWGSKNASGDYASGLGSTKPVYPITISAWVKIRAFSTWRIFFRPYGTTWVSPYTTCGLYLDASGVPAASANTSATEHSTAATNTVCALGEWCFLAATYDGTTLTVWKNGDSVATAAVSGALDYGTGTAWYLGDNGLIPGEQGQGELDDVRVATVARSAAWMKEVYLRGVGRWAP